MYDPDMISIDWDLLPPGALDPSTKAEASWENGMFETADGWMYSDSFTRRDYQYLRAIDLVRYFTHRYLEEQKKKKKAAEEARKPVRDLNLELGIPNPRRLPKSRGNRRNRHGNRKATMHFPILEMPLEVQQTIFSFAIPSGRILVHGNHPNKLLHELKSTWSTCDGIILRPQYRLSHLLDNNDIDNDACLSLNLLLLCKKLSKVVEEIMYSQIRFCFNSMKAINRFLDQVPKDGLMQIRRLELCNAGYGSPRQVEIERFKALHDKKWDETCKRIGQEMPALRELYLRLNIQDMPLNLRANADWWKPLQKLIPRGPIKHVDVHLTSKYVGEDRLARGARRLEDNMMTRYAKHKREEKEANNAIRRFYEAEAAAEAARKERLKTLPRVQAKNVLRITLNDINKTNEAKKPAKKYYTSKTAGYARELKYDESIF